MPRMSRTRPAAINLGDIGLDVVRGPRTDGRWYWRARSGADRETIWTGWATRDEAMREGAKLLMKPAADLAVTRATLRKVGDVVRSWLDAQDANLDIRPSTRKNCHKYARHLLRLLAGLPIEALKRGPLEDYRTKRLVEKAAPRTIRQELRAMRSAWKRACELRLIPNRALPDVSIKVRDYVLNHRTPTEQEVMAILPFMIPEEALALQLLTATGARLNEIMKLPRKAIDLGTRVLKLDGKTGPREFPLTEDLEALLAGRLDGSDRLVLNMPQGHPDQRMRNAITRACEKAGVAPFTPHGLRRLAVDRMARSGVEVATAASLTGHNPIVMLNDYRQVRPEELLEAMIRAEVDAVLRRCA